MRSIFLFIALLMFTTTMAQNGIVACYPFSGSADNSANSLHHGTVFGATLTADRFGNPNQAYSFDGVDDYITVPHHDDLNYDVNDDFTISLWMKAPTLQQNITNQINSLISKWEDDVVNLSYPYDLRMYNQSASGVNVDGTLWVVRFDETCANFSNMTSTTTLNDNTYHHIVFQKSGADLRVFLDGALAFSFTDLSTCFTTNPHDLSFGRRGGSLNNNYFTGELDDIVFYNYAVDTSVINCLYTSTGSPCECMCSPTFDTIAVDACDPYMAPSGQVWDSTGTYNDTLVNSGGCDSVLTVNLTVTEIDTTILLTLGGGASFAVADTVGATFQWIDCLDGNSPIPGETKPSFVPMVSGSYAVIITKNGCSDTTGCIFASVGLPEWATRSSVKVFPNPSDGPVQVQLDEPQGPMTFRLMDGLGRIVFTEQMANSSHYSFELPLARGIYHLEMQPENKPNAVFQLIRSQ